MKTLTLLVLSALFVAHSYGSDDDLEDLDPPQVFLKNIGDYRITITKKRYEQEVLVSRGAKQLFKDRGFSTYYNFGNRFDGSIVDRDAEHDPYSGTDVTGNKQPNLVISKDTNGSMCCHTLYVFELGKTFKRLLTLKTWSYSIKLQDLDHDGFPEIEFWDEAPTVLLETAGFATPGRVVLKYGSKGYTVASNLMRQPTPTNEEFARMQARIRNAYDSRFPASIHHEVLKSMVDLSYSGHPDLALKLAGEAWPLSRDKLEGFKAEFRKELEGSKYWKKFASSVGAKW